MTLLNINAIRTLVHFYTFYSQELLELSQIISSLSRVALSYLIQTTLFLLCPKARSLQERSSSQSCERWPVSLLQALALLHLQCLSDLQVL